MNTYSQDYYYIFTVCLFIFSFCLLRSNSEKNEYDEPLKKKKKKFTIITIDAPRTTIVKHEEVLNGRFVKLNNVGFERIAKHELNTSANLLNVKAPKTPHGFEIIPGGTGQKIVWSGINSNHDVNEIPLPINLLNELVKPTELCPVMQNFALDEWNENDEFSLPTDLVDEVNRNFYIFFEIKY